MKTRASFVSNSSSSCFIVKYGSVDDARKTFVESVAEFLDSKEGEDTERHIQQAKDFLDNSFIRIFKLDKEMPRRELQKLMCWAKIEDYVDESDWDSVMVVDQDENTLEWKFGYDEKGDSAVDYVCRAFGSWPVRLEPDYGWSIYEDKDEDDGAGMRPCAPPSGWERLYEKEDKKNEG